MRLLVQLGLSALLGHRYTVGWKARAEPGEQNEWVSFWGYWLGGDGACNLTGGSATEGARGKLRVTS